MFRIVGRVVLVLVCVAVGLSAGIGYGQYRLKNERGEHEQAIKELKRKMALVQQSVIEERNRIVSLEGQNRTLHAESVKLREERTSFEAEAKDFDGKLRLAEARIKELTEAQSSGKAALAAIEKKCTEAAQARVDQVVKRCEAAVEQIKGQKGLVESALKGTKEALDRCVGNNKALCALARDILDKYENRGVFSRVMENEPFTQIKRVELEKFVQEYGAKIDEKEVKTDKSE